MAARRHCQPYPTIMLSLLIFILLAIASANEDEGTLYRVFPQRISKEAAVVEWGHSAIISALDGAVATFGPQTSQGANFEVETAPVLANPIDGVDRQKRNTEEEDLSLSKFEREYPGKLKNADEVAGNLVIMTDAAGLSGVTMARIAKESGAAALMVVNTDQNAGDFIYSLEPENEEEAAYAEEHIDIPVIMVSLQAGNVITTALATDDMDPNEVNKGKALPERVRLYAGGDRPFFEDALSTKPMLYLIHNMLTAEECDALIRMAEGKYDLVDDSNGVNNYLENTMANDVNGQSIAVNIERMTLWKGGIAGKLIKDIDERVSQVTGFPPEHFSDFQINKYTKGSFQKPHYDINPMNGIMASITVFLNDVPEEQSGELVFPKPEDGQEPVLIRPRKGVAVVHHNTDEKYNFDKSTLHEELPLIGDSAVKYVAKKYVYLNPQPQAVRIVLPLIAIPFGGKLPRVFSTLQNTLIEKYGPEAAEDYFQKIVTGIPLLILLGIASIVSSLVRSGLKMHSEKRARDSAEQSRLDGKKKSKGSKSKFKKSD